VRRGTFWLAGTEVPVGVGRLDDLARRLQERGVGRIGFDMQLEADAIGTLLDVLLCDATEVVTAGGFAAVYFARPQRGISIDDADWRTFARLMTPAAAPKPDITVPDLEATVIEDAVIEPTVEAMPEAPPIEAPLVESPEPAEAEALDLLDALDPLLPADPSAPAEEPLDEIGERLRELDGCDDDARYRDFVRQLAFDASSRIEQGGFDDAWRVLEHVTRHAGDDAKRSFVQRESARECVMQLVRGAALGDLIRRACDDDIDLSLRAIGVLREIGSIAVPRLLDEIEREPSESNRRARLIGALFAMGEEAAPALAHAIASDRPRRQHVALRLAGDSQNPRLVPDLRDALLGGAREVAREAAQALVRIGDVSSLEVLSEALECGRPEIVSLAAQGLGSTGRALAVPPLAAALDRATRARDLSLARDLVRSLGRLGRSEAVPILTDLLGRGGFLERRRLRELKIAAVHAIGHISGRAADEALARIEKHGEASQREAAALARRRRATKSENASPQ
jgi:HEAT repeat protein